jgi:hypothetical protein
MARLIAGLVIRNCILALPNQSLRGPLPASRSAGKKAARSWEPIARPVVFNERAGEIHEWACCFLGALERARHFRPAFRSTEAPFKNYLKFSHHRHARIAALNIIGGRAKQS